MRDFISKQGLHLITELTPNGKKVQIFLEELKDAYDFQWTTSLIDLETDEQKEDWFLRLNPNGTLIQTPLPSKIPEGRSVVTSWQHESRFSLTILRPHHL